MVEVEIVKPFRNRYHSTNSRQIIYDAATSAGFPGFYNNIPHQNKVAKFIATQISNRFAIPQPDLMVNITHHPTRVEWLINVDSTFDTYQAIFIVRDINRQSFTLNNVTWFKPYDYS